MAKLKAPYIGRQGTVDLDEQVFGEPFHMALVHEAVRSELNARRRGTASTRTRAQIAMTGAKAWRQKGTGRARAGALSTPQRTGGGVAHGPKPRHYTSKVNRKARRKALRSALSLHAERGSLGVVDASSYDEPSTKTAAAAIEGFRAGRALVVLAREGEEACRKSFPNLLGVYVDHADSAGIADVVGAARVVASPAALERLTELARPPAARDEQEAA